MCLALSCIRWENCERAKNKSQGYPDTDPSRHGESPAEPVVGRLVKDLERDQKDC